MGTLFALFLSTLFVSSSYSNADHEFVYCLSQRSPPLEPMSGIIFTETNASYTSLLESSAQNLRFSTSRTPKPEFIITPLIDSHVQATVMCCRKHGLQIRMRSGGHDYEGLSYTSEVPFILLDLVNMRSIHVDLKDNSMWVEAGATIGEVYYRIAEKSPIHGFPGGNFPTVGVGGLFSGGGFGTMLRKYGLSADNIVDALMVDVNGRILDRESMGEDLFWAIRGGGGASFGIILSWKIILVKVPPVVTVFQIPKTVGQGATNLVYKWQNIGQSLDENLFIRVKIHVVSTETERTIQATFKSLFLGRADQLLAILDDTFPELGVEKEDCAEMSWIESVLYFSGYPEGETKEVLLNPKPPKRGYFKATALEELWKWSLQEEKATLLLDPFGGRMSQISESDLPFPHRKGNLYAIMYFVEWEEEDTGGSERHMEWMRRVYKHMASYVSQNPRAAYVNYRDLDLGQNELADTTYKQATVWGSKYFKDNFRRLAIVKSFVDPTNFFAFEQSIPPLILREGKLKTENNKKLFSVFSIPN
ncbi:Tetrahydroberberine oxidase [Bertholletia excelsa]